MQQNVKIGRALFSVSDKTGITDFASFLSHTGVEILSTGGTAKTLRDASVPVLDVSDYTGFAEIMDGRVKTLHPHIHAGLLARRGTDDEVLAKSGIGTIDLLVCNLYPFAETIARRNVTFDEAIENIDIGGPAMLRAASKNHAHVVVLCHPTDIEAVRQEIEATGGVSAGLRRRLAATAFEHTARYDTMISTWFSTQLPVSTESREEDAPDPLPRELNIRAVQIQEMRYGENPHQRAAFYSAPDAAKGTLAKAEVVQGKPLSFNNIADADAALECVRAFDSPACVIVKHANPCGVALRDDIASAYQAAFKTDPTSAFGGIIAFNRPLDGGTATDIIRQQFVEVVLAPRIDADARQVFEEKPAVRVLETGEAQAGQSARLSLKCVDGGILAQEQDLGALKAVDMTLVSRRAPTEDELRDLAFAWTVVKYVKSNAIIYVRDEMTIGIGAGQMSRVYSARIAGIKAEDESLTVKGSVMASDAFFPFRDGIDAAAEAGIAAVVQPGGSIRDDEVIQAANEHNIAMLFTGMRHFRH